MADEVKKYKLLGVDGKVYLSDTPGTCGNQSTESVYDSRGILFI